MSPQTHQRLRPGLGLVSAVTVVSVLGAVLAPPPAGYAAALSFPDGHWSGDATLIGGARGNGVSYRVTGGGCGFELTIAGGRVTGGSIHCEGSTEGDIEAGGRTLHVTTRSRADGSLPGSASSVTGPLSTTYSGTVTGLGAGGPYHTSGTAIIQPQTVDCAVASGDLDSHWRAVQQSLGMDSTEQAIFYAVRDSGTGTGSGALPATAGQFNKLMGDLAALAAEGARKMGAANYLTELERLANQAVAYLSNVLAKARCPAGAPPAAWQQDMLARAFQTAIDHAFVGPNGVSFTLPQWAEVLTLGLQTNAVVPPRSGPGSENALWDAIEAELGKQLAAAIADDDQSAIFDIYTLAYGAGMSDLAAQALKAMKK